MLLYLLQIIIDVEDVNDNSPKFQLSTYTFKLSEDTSVGGPLVPLEGKIK